MSWNYRVMKFDDCVGIVEAYYDEAGNLNGYTNPMVVGDHQQGLVDTLQMMKSEAEHVLSGEAEVLDTKGDGAFTDLETKLQEALKDATDHYVALVCSNLPDISLEEAYELPEVKRWYGLADLVCSARAKHLRHDDVLS